MLISSMPDNACDRPMEMTMSNIEKDTESEFNTIESQKMWMSGIAVMVASNNFTAVQCFNEMKKVVTSAWQDRQVNKNRSKTMNNIKEQFEDFMSHGDRRLQLRNSVYKEEYDEYMDKNHPDLYADEVDELYSAFKAGVHLRELEDEQEPKPSGLCVSVDGMVQKFNRETLKKVTQMKSSDLSQEITTISENSGERCHASTDGECSSAQCPQLKDNEPSISGRHCPLDTQDDVYL